MIRFALRMAVAGGREAVVRLVAIAAAVTLGVGMLLATLAGVNAVNAQNARFAWLNTTPATTSAAPHADPAWWLLREDYLDRQEIGRIDVAATGPDSPVPPGIPALPGPGEYYASPALTALLAQYPHDQLADRYPGRQIGTIGPAALPSPQSLMIVVGHTPAELSQVNGAAQITDIATVSPGDCVATCFVGTREAGMDLILSVVAAGLLFPLLIFIGTATRLSAARREQRFAAMRLIGATPRQISVIAAVEATVSALAGTVVGFGLFFLIRNAVAGIPFTGASFYPADLSLNLADVLLVALGVPAGAALAAWVALRRVRISPLGVTRRTTPRPPRAYRLIPLLVGVAELNYFNGRRPQTGIGQVEAFLPGILVMMVGLVVAGPWLTMVGARVMAHRARRPAALIAARRLADNPQAGFRAISGLMLALFVTSVAVGVITTIVAHRGADQSSSPAGTPVSMDFWGDRASNPVTVPPAVTAVTTMPGVRRVIVVRHNTDFGRDHEPTNPGLVDCADLERVGDLGHCAPGAEVAIVWEDVIGPDPAHGGTWTGPATVWPTAPLTLAEFARIPVLSVTVSTDGATPTIERVRTALELAFPGALNPPGTQADYDADFTRTLTGWRQLANVIILSSLPIAGCSLAVAVVGGLTERRRPFSLLRLTGVPLRVLRRVVGLESAVPLLIVAVVATGAGLLAAQLFLRAQLRYTLVPPPVGYYLIVLAGIAASLGIIASTLPLLRRVTGPETARNE